MKIGEEVNNCTKSLIINCSLCLHSARRQKPILPLLIGGRFIKTTQCRIITLTHRCEIQVRLTAILVSVV